jgi:uncharacterized protein (UPF0332 family)
VAIVNYEHLLDQAEQLIVQSAAGAPRQADIRRAISTAYYALFHFILTGAADEFVGVTKRLSSRYTIVYRSINHSVLKKLCERLSNPKVSPDMLKHFPRSGLGANLPALASAVVELQEKRHLADYDPSKKFKTSDARRAIDTANGAIARFNRLNQKRRQAFVTLLCFPQR